MSSFYMQAYVHFVFAVKYRAALLNPEWDQRVRSYITAIVQNSKHRMLAINNMPDHMHIFIALHPAQSISNLMQQVKGGSSKWINEQQLTKYKFQWQEGYGAFTHPKSHIDMVVRYIRNQQEHHKKVTFLNEYKKILRDNGVEYDERYIFKEPED